MSETASAPGPQYNGEVIGRMKAKIKDLSRQLEERTKAHADAVAELGKARQDAEPLRAEVDGLRGRIRDGLHRSAFARLAKEAGVRDRAADALYRLSDWKADRDEVDEAGMQAAILKLRESHDYAFEPDGRGDGQAGGPTPAPTPPPAERPVPGAGRGGAHNPSRTAITLTKEQLADPKFMLDPRNKEMIQGARIRLPDRRAQ